MTDSGGAAQDLFESITSVRHVDGMIANGEAEALHLECKAPATPRLNREQKVTLARAISGFSNSSGGVLAWGVSTTKHSSSGLDILSQIEPIGNIVNFEQQVKRAIPSLTTPPVLRFRSKVLVRRKKDTRGIALTYIPQTSGDPVQSALDNKFYFRSGDEFVVAPYEMIKRLFAATESPDLRPVFDIRLAKCDANRVWTIPFAIQNLSSAVAEHTRVSLSFKNADACEIIECRGFVDASALNPGERLFWSKVDGVVHRSISHFVGDIRVKMRVGKRAKRRLDLTIRLFANKMRAKEMTIALRLVRAGLTARTVDDDFLY